MNRKGKMRKNKINNCNNSRACTVDSMYHILIESVKKFCSFKPNIMQFVSIMFHNKDQPINAAQDSH